MTDVSEAVTDFETEQPTVVSSGAGVLTVSSPALHGAAYPSSPSVSAPQPDARADIPPPAKLAARESGTEIGPSESETSTMVPASHTPMETGPVTSSPRAESRTRKTPSQAHSVAESSVSGGAVSGVASEEALMARVMRPRKQRPLPAAPDTAATLAAVTASLALLAPPSATLTSTSTITATVCTTSVVTSTSSASAIGPSAGAAAPEPAEEEDPNDWGFPDITNVKPFEYVDVVGLSREQQFQNKIVSCMDYYFPEQLRRLKVRFRVRGVPHETFTLSREDDLVGYWTDRTLAMCHFLHYSIGLTFAETREVLASWMDSGAPVPPMAALQAFVGKLSVENMTRNYPFQYVVECFWLDGMDTLEFAVQGPANVHAVMAQLNDMVQRWGRREGLPAPVLERSPIAFGVT